MNVERGMSRAMPMVMAAGLAVAPQEAMTAAGLSEDSVATAHAWSYEGTWGTELGPIEGWPQLGEDIYQPLTLMSAEPLQGELHLAYSQYMPQSYREAFEEALDQPIVELAVKEGAVSSVTVESRPSENGGYYPDSGDVVFELSDSDPDRTYTSSENIKAVVDHEFAHALAERWYDYYEFGDVSGDPILDAHIENVRETCLNLRELIYRDYIAANRSELAQAFDQSARAFEAAEGSGPMHAEWSVPYPKDLRDAATAIRDDDPAVYLPIGEPMCRPVGLYDMTDWVVDSGASFMHFPEAQPIAVELGAYSSYVISEYSCVKDGLMMADRTKDSTPNSAGHPRDNATEMTASTIATLLHNPSYLTQCMAEMASDQHREAFVKYVQAILDITEYTAPELIDIMRQDPQTAAVVDLFMAEKPGR